MNEVFPNVTKENKIDLARLSEQKNQRVNIN